MARIGGASSRRSNTQELLSERRAPTSLGFGDPRSNLLVAVSDGSGLVEFHLLLDHGTEVITLLVKVYDNVVTNAPVGVS